MKMAEETPARVQQPIEEGKGEKDSWGINDIREALETPRRESPLEERGETETQGQGSQVLKEENSLTGRTPPPCNILKSK